VIMSDISHVEITVLPLADDAKPLTKKELKQLDELTQGLRIKLGTHLKDLISIGQDFHEIKRLLGHGQFMPYLEKHFDMSYRTANRFMHVAEAFGPHVHVEAVSQLSQRAMYLLSSTSVLEETRSQIIGQLKEGKILTYDEIQSQIQTQNETEFPKEEMITEKKVKIGSFSKGFNKLYITASHGIKDFSGPITEDHKIQLKQVQTQLKELDEWIKELLEKPESPTAKSDKSGKK